MALSAKEGRRQKESIRREARREEKRRARAHLAKLRTQLKEARAQRKVKLRDASARCREDRARARGRAKETRRLAAVELRTRLLDDRAGQQQACMIRREEARSGARTAKERFDAERAFRADMRRNERDNRQRMIEARPAKRSRAEAIRESDDEVRQNIDPELVPLWDRVKGHIHGNTRKSRTEAFLHYAAEHPGEVLEILNDRTDALIRDLERQEREHRAQHFAPARRSWAKREEAPF